MTDSTQGTSSNTFMGLNPTFDLYLTITPGELPHGEGEIRPLVVTPHHVPHQVETTQTHYLWCGDPYIDSAPLSEQIPSIEAGKIDLKQLRGEFFVIVVDKLLCEVHLYNDKFSTIPVYYHADYRQLNIATRLPEALSVAPFAPQGIFDYFYFHMIPAEQTLFEDVKKLPAATQLTYQGNTGAVTSRPYWVPDFQKAQRPSTQSDLANELKRALKASVKQRILGKTGAFLSGGLDSSTVAGMLAEIQPGSDVFSIGFDAEGYDEIEYARITAEHFGLKLHEYYVTPEDIVKALPEIIPFFDEPFGNSSALPAYFCTRMAKSWGMDTLLAGDGGDELFAGNERYAKQKVFSHYESLPKALRQSVLEPFSEARMPTAILRKVQSYIRQAAVPLPRRLQTYNFLEREPLQNIFEADFLRQVDPNAAHLRLDHIYHRPEHGSDLDRMMYLDWQITLADNDLVKVNNMSHINDIHVRYPMLDDDLVELSTQVPDQLKLKGQNLRHFYKEALTGWLPNATINKSKHGFGLPFGVWLKDYAPLTQMAYDALSRLKKRHIVQASYIDHIIHEHKFGHSAYYGEMIWLMMTLELWLDAHNGSK